MATSGSTEAGSKGGDGGKRASDWLTNLQKSRKRTRMTSARPFRLDAKRVSDVDGGGGGEQGSLGGDGGGGGSADSGALTTREEKTPRAQKKRSSRSAPRTSVKKPVGPRRKQSAEARQKIKLAIQEVRPPRFDLTDPADRERGMAYLALEGYVVWSNVVPHNRIAEHLGRLWDYIEAACAGVLRADPSTWTNARWPGVLSMFIFRFHGIGQSDFMWHVRTLPLVRVFFEHHFRRLERLSLSPTASLGSPKPASPSSPPLSPLFLLSVSHTFSTSTTSSTSSSSSLSAVSTLTPVSAGSLSSLSSSALYPTTVSPLPSSSSSLTAPATSPPPSPVPLVRSDMALATSFDGCSVLRGAEHEQPFTTSWLHVDENLAQTRHADHSVQCAVNFVSGRPSTHGGFVCVPRSHTHYKKLYADSKSRGADASETSPINKNPKETKLRVDDDAEMRRFTSSKSHYVPLPSASCAMLRPFCNSSGAVKVVALAVEAGDMVSWMSTLTHANTPPTARPPRTTSKKKPSKRVASSSEGKTISGRDEIVINALRRVAAFVSMYPKDKLDAHKADPTDWLARRQAACAAAFTAGHDPVNPSENNVCRRGRHPSFAAVATPLTCKKTAFTSAEHDIL